MTTTSPTGTDAPAPAPEDEPLRVLLVIGSTRQDRFGPTPAAWAADHARRRPDVRLDVADLAEPALPVVHGGDDPAGSPPDVVRDLGARLERADAAIIVTPVYNRGYPASVKNAIDWFTSEWAATPVGFVSYGGRTGGVEAVEQLRTVFVELNTMTIRNVLSFPDFWEHFDGHGAPTDPAGSAAAATAFYDQLTWWARALRSARVRSTA